MNSILVLFSFLSKSEFEMFCKEGIRKTSYYFDWVKKIYVGLLK
jgi:hypothetical protein